MLGINSELSFFYIFICVLIGLLYAYFLYLKDKSNLPINLTYILFILRLFFISLLVFLLLNPAFISHVKDIEKPIVIIAKDASQSIKEDVSDDLDVLLEGLDDFELLLYSFSDKVYEGLSEFNNGLKTNYSHLFLDLDEKMYNRNISGVIMVSDGCYNAGINPEYLSYNFPIYSIALGDTVTY